MANNKVKVEERGGELVVDKPEVTLKHKRDSMTIVNKAGRSSIFWKVPPGPFEDSPFCIEVKPDEETSARIAAAHREATTYTYQVLRKCPDEKQEPQERQGGGRPADPIIIIDVDR